MNFVKVGSGWEFRKEKDIELIMKRENVKKRKI